LAQLAIAITTALKKGNHDAANQLYEQRTVHTGKTYPDDEGA